MPPHEMLDVLLAVPRLGGTSVSPDGAWIAWTWYGLNPTAEVYAAPTDGSRPALRLTDTDQDVELAGWTPDSRGIIVAQDRDGDERVQLSRVDLNRPLDLRPLTEASPPYFLQGGQLHPNGRWLVYGMNFDVETGQEIEPTWVYRHDLETGRRLPLARPARAGWTQPELNDAGTHILYARKDVDPAGSQVWLVDIEGRDDREILSAGPTAKVDASWFPDSRHVLFLAEAGAYRRLGIWDLDTGSARWLIDDPSRNIEWAFAPRGSERLCAIVVELRDARVRATILDVETGAEERMPDIPGDLLPRRPIGDGVWVGRYSSSTHPDDLVRFRLSDDRAEELISLTGLWERTTLRPRELRPAEVFRWRSVDGLEIQGWLYRPHGTPRGTIVQIHGGPTSHSADTFLPNVQYFASQGFNVLTPNYRGSTGFGLGFQECIKQDGWGGREQDDIRAGIEALIAARIAEPGKVGVTGTSYGGYSSWCAITRWPPEIVSAAAPICGMTDLVVDYQTTRPDLRPYSEEMLGGSPEQIPDLYRERSPIHFVDRIQGRLLIVQGLRDPNVTPENVRAVRDALDDTGIPYEILTFDDEGHGISHRANRRVLYQRLVDFFARAFASLPEATATP